MPVGSAGDANMSMSAINAMQNIFSHQQVSSTHQRPNVGKPVLGSQPVTPVKVDRYEKLLVGYSPAY